MSPNGRFALLFGVAAGPLAILPPQPVEVELADLTTGKITVIGQQPAGSGQVVANDGTAVVETASVVQVVGPQGAVTIAPSYSINTLQIAADASRIVYDTYEANAGIRVLDLSSGVDSPLTAGNFPKLANDGHRFTYLNATGLNTGGQVWLGDAFSGALEALTNEPEGIADQTITGDGSTVFAATNSGRVLAIDVASGAVTQLLDSAPPQFLALYSTPVPGSYNWVSGTSDTSLQVRLGGVPAIELGADPAASELVIQVPWEVQPDPAASIVVWGKEPAWEQVIGTGVSALAGTSVMLDALGDSAIHQDWSRLVTFNDPAQPGEIIHTYGTGWGPVDGAVPSGQPTPAGRLYTITAPCQWQAIGNPLQAAEPFAALFAGLAPGLIGLYQLDFLIPMHWAYRTFTPECVIPGSNPNILAAVPMAP